VKRGSVVSPNGLFEKRPARVPLEVQVSRYDARTALSAQLSNPDEADVYFTDRMAAPSSSFVPPSEPVAPTTTDPTGYLPDRECCGDVHGLILDQICLSACCCTHVLVPNPLFSLLCVRPDATRHTPLTRCLAQCTPRTCSRTIPRYLAQTVYGG
jgi:hypothetical protein